MTALERAIEQLNEEQKTALEALGHIVVMAPPGSGKTKLLVTRLAHDLAQRIARPRGAACITLTTAAASELNARLGGLGEDTRSNLFVGTVHGFALHRIVRPFAGLAGLEHLATSRVTRAKEADGYWHEALVRAGMTPDRRLYSTVRKMRSEFASDDDWGRSGDALRARDAYLDLLHEREVMDFAMIIEAAVEIVENLPAAQAALRAAFAQIYVDEYQDLAPGLDRIVRALCLDAVDGSCKLFAVGDPDQAIYGWTGTDSRLLLELASLPNVSTVALQSNYRCGARISEISQRLFDESRNLTAHNAGGEVTAKRLSGGLRSQLDWIAAETVVLVSAGVSPEAIGVLCRTNDLAAEAAETIEERGVATWRRQEADWESMLTTWLERASSMALGFSSGSIRSVVNELSRVVPDLDLDTAGEVTALLLTLDAQDSTEDVVAELSSLLSKLSPEAAATVADEFAPLLRHLGNDQALSEIGDFSNRTSRVGRVYVTTLSAAKGLEFDYVFIPDCDEGRIPYYTSLNDARELEEERNKFYVGITRAKLRVSLTWSGFTLDRYGRRHNCSVSQFVRRLKLNP